MNKLDFVARQLDRAQSKKYEHYVVHRIWHRLNDPDLKIITQQFVSRPTGRAMTDMYFPQLGIHIEIDEPHHLKQDEADKLRQADIVNATSHTFIRVKVCEDIAEFDEQIENAVTQIAEARDRSKNFVPWDPDKEMNPQTFIDKGFIDAEEDVAFRTIADAASCFGRRYTNLQLSFIPHPSEANCYLWFPKLYENEEWLNSLSKDENEIREICKKPGKREAQVDKNIQTAERKGRRLVFARGRGPLNDLMYRFKGEYEIDLAASNYQNGAVFKRKKTRVRTYQPKA